MDDDFDSMRNAIVAAFRKRYPHGKIDVEFDVEKEMWEVVTNNKIFTFQCGSDDDAFIFECNNGNDENVVIPL